MVAICPITLSNAHDGPSVAVIIQVKQRDRRASRRRSPHNAQTVGVPGKVIRPPLAARIEQWDDLVRLWIASFDAIAPTFVTVAAGQGQVIVLIRAPSRLGPYMVDGKANELPAFIGMAILTAAMRAFAHDTPR